MHEAFPCNAVSRKVQLRWRRTELQECRLFHNGKGIFQTSMLRPLWLSGKLFPGPHLYAGAAIVVLWATAASLVPAMSRGNEAARTAHITLNSLNLLLFAWQVCMGMLSPKQMFSNVTIVLLTMHGSIGGSGGRESI